MDRDRDNGGFVGFIIRNLISSFIYNYVNVILTLTTIELYQYLYKQGYSTISRYLIIIFINGILITASISVIMLIVKMFGINIGSYHHRYWSAVY